MTTLNDAFEQELTLEDEGYDSGSESLNIPTPLQRTPHLYHLSTGENLSFRPATPHTHQTHSPHEHSSLSSLCYCLKFSDSSSTDTSPFHGRTEHSSPEEQQMVWHLTNDSFQAVIYEEEEEDFPTAPLWLCWDGRTRSRQALMHPWIFTTA